MIRVGLACLALWSAVACGRSRGVPDEELGGLVIEPSPQEQPLDLARGRAEPAELGRILMQPHRRLVTALGPHAVSIAATTTVEEGGKPVTELGEQTTLELGDGATFKAAYTNTADYGREATFVGGTLYLRPRYQRWHARAPETADEPAALRDQYVEPIGAVWDLLAPGVELTDQGAAEVAGRPGRKIAIKLAPMPRKPASEPLAQRRWRENRVVEELTGEVILDADHPVALSVRLAGTVAFTRDGRRFRMKTSVTAAVAAIGTPAAITAPAPEEVVATPERQREVDDRDFLLQGIAPPIRQPASDASKPDRKGDAE